VNPIALFNILAAFRDHTRRLRYRAQGKRRIHFLHIGKTGGTALKDAFSKHLVTRSYALDLHAHSFKLKDVPCGEGVVFFVRDPVTRFVSGFYSRFREGRPKLYNPWSSEEKSAFEHFATPNALALALSSPDADERYSAKSAMRQIGHVRNHYTYWLGSREYLLSRIDDIFFVGFQETLLSDFEVLKRRLHLPTDVSLPVDDKNAHRNPLNVEKSLELKAWKNLAAWYAVDYELLDACKKIAETAER